MKKLHKRNTKVLSDIIETIGYHTIDKVGKESSEATWLIIQHSIGQPDFMKKCVELLGKAVNENKADAKNLACLTDRIASYEDKPQLYGTQFDWDENGELSPKPFDDLAKVNQRRKLIGFNTLEEQTEFIRQGAKKENEISPTDSVKRKRKYDKWRREVGWIK